MAKTNGGDQGKLEFVRQILEQDSNANETAVNDAWQAAGHPGTISRSSVGKVRSEMGLTNRRRRRKKAEGQGVTGRRAGRPKMRRGGRGGRTAGAAVPASARGNGAIAGAGAAAAGDRDQVIQDLEGDLDRILFQVMGLGGLAEVEELIRRSRRLLILGSQG
jgi:hypothetical protein